MLTDPCAQVYGRKFERELEALRKEMAATPSLTPSNVSSPQPKERALSNPETAPASPLIRGHSGSISEGVALLAGDASPLVLTPSKSEADLEGFSLDDSAVEVKPGQETAAAEEASGVRQRKPTDGGGDDVNA